MTTEHDAEHHEPSAESNPKTIDRGVLFRYVSNLYEKLDKSSLVAEISAMQREDPLLTPTDLSARVVTEAKASASSAGVASGMVSALPVVGGLISLPTLGTEVAYLLAQEVYVVLKIAGLFGHDVFDQEARLNELVSILGRSNPKASTGRRAGQMEKEAMRKVTTRGILKIAQRATLRVSSRFIPFLGSVVGGLVNYSSMEEAGALAIRYYQSLQPASES